MLSWQRVLPGEGGTFPLRNQIDEPPGFEFVPVDGRVAIAVEVFEGHEPAVGNLADGFAGGVGHGSVQIVLGHRLLLGGERERKRPPHTGAIAWKTQPHHERGAD